MSNSILQTNRFCCKIDKQVESDSEGFLSDPESNENKHMHFNISNVADYDKSKVFILLGESGIGKSYVLGKMKDRADQEYGTLYSVWIDLQRVYSKDNLFAKISKAYKSNGVNNSGKYFTLFLDGLDECLERGNLASEWITDVIDELELKNSTLLRLTCRAISWPESLETQLEAMYSDVSVRKLLPLRKKDSTEISHRSLSDCEVNSLFEYIVKYELGSFAARPITLKMLVQIWSDEELKKVITKIELYRKSLLHMCREHSKIRRERGFTSDRTPNELFRIACRIAVVTIFCRKTQILEDGLTNDDGDNGIDIAVFVGGDELSDNGSFAVEKKDVKDALLTPMFRSIGSEKYEWSHKSFQEFLAAEYLLFYDIDVKLANTLFKENWSGRGYIIPQFHGVASWFATSMAKFRNQLINSEPELLQNSDLSLYSDHEIAILLENIVKRLEENKLFELSTGIIQYMSDTSAKALLVPIIGDKTKKVITRRAFLRVIRDAPSRNLNRDLLSIALDPTDDPQIRALAVSALSSHGTLAQKHELAPLLSCPSDQDPRDELKGSIIEVLWPGKVSSKRLFQCLPEPQDTSYYGSYWIAVQFRIPSHLSREHSIDALSWLLRVNPKDDELGMLRELISRVYEISFLAIDKPEVRELLSKVISKRIKEKATPLPHYVERSLKSKMSIENKKLLLKRIVGECGTYSRFASGIYMYESILVKDEKWLIEQFNLAERIEEKSVWMDIILNTVDVSIADIRALVEKSFYRSDLSKKAKKWLTAYDERNESETVVSDNEALCSDIAMSELKAKSLVSNLVAGIIVYTSWFELLEIALGDRWVYRDHSDESWIEDVREKLSSKWSNGEQTANLKCLFRRMLDSSLDLANRRVCIAGAYGLIYFNNYWEISEILNLNLRQLNNCIQIAVVAMNRYYLTNSAIEKLIMSVKINMLDDLCKIVKEELIYAISKEDPRLSTKLFGLIWSDEVEKVCYEELERVIGKDEVEIVLFWILIGNGSRVAIQYAKRILKSRLFKQKRSITLRKALALEMLHSQSEGAWCSIWREIRRDTVFGEEVMQAYAHLHYQRDENSLLSILQPCELSMLYKWLRKRFPPEEDKVYKEAHVSDKRESVAEFRDSIPMVLANRKTIKAERELRGLCKYYKGDINLQWQYTNALKTSIQYQSENTECLEPKELLSMIKNSKEDRGVIARVWHSKTFKTFSILGVILGLVIGLMTIIKCIDGIAHNNIRDNTVTEENGAEVLMDTSEHSELEKYINELEEVIKETYEILGSTYFELRLEHDSLSP